MKDEKNDSAKRAMTLFLWTSGASLVVVGATKIWNNALGILIAGAMILFTASVLIGLGWDR